MKQFLKSFTLSRLITIVLSSGLVLLSAVQTFGEGSKELHPKRNQNGPYLQIWDGPNLDTRKFMTYDPDSLYRLNVKICNLGEKVFFGFRQDDRDCFFRIKGPNNQTIQINGAGADQDPAANVFTYRVPTTGNGYINTWDEATAGPRPFAAAGYTPLSFIPKVAGDYYIEFNPQSATATRKLTRRFLYFDMTVVDTVNANAIRTGRLWSRAWDINCNNGTNTFDTRIFVYSKDSVVTAIDFNGMQPFGFVISCNSTGCTNTGVPAADRRSRVGNITYPEYRLFLNNPDQSCYPSKPSFGALTGNISISGCDPRNRCINIPVDRAGKVEILLDFDLPAGYNGRGSKDTIISANVKVGNNCIPWNSRDAKGQLIAANATFPVEVNYFNGLTHLPLFDVENHRNGYSVSLVRPASITPPRLFWDDTEVSAGQALDTKVQTLGVVTGHRWTNRGDNSCGGGPQNCPETINTWWYGNVIRQTTTFKDTSINVDANRLTPETGSPFNDTTVCTNTTGVQLRGIVSGFTNTGIWTNKSTPANNNFQGGNTNFDAIYVPTIGEKVAGNKVTLRLSSTGNGICGAISDTMQIFFIQGPVVDAGPSSVIRCKNNPDVQLSGTKNSVATTIQWFGGTGTFVPNRTVLNPIYRPSAAEITAGSNIVLTLRSTAQGSCTPAEDFITISFTDPANLNTGGAASLCKNNPTTVSLNTTATVVGGTVVWSGGTLSGFANTNSLTNSYTPSAAEVAAGAPINLTVSYTTPTCSTVTATKTINFVNAPTVSAGSSLLICQNKSDAQLGGSSSTGKGKWSFFTTGSGTFIPNDSTLNAVYRPSNAEATSGARLRLRFTSTSNSGGCLAESDTMSIAFKGSPVVVAGGSKNVCANNPLVTISGASSTTGSAVWTGGSGVFSPSRNVINPTYTPTSSEVLGGVVLLFLNSTNNDICNVAKDSILILVTQPPRVNAGPDQSVCTNNKVVTLSGFSATGTSSPATWTKSPNDASFFTPGTGGIVTFTPFDTIGNYTLTYTGVNTNVNCLNVTDQLLVSFTPRPKANAGSDKTVCKNNPNVQLNGTSSTGKAKWTGGLGRFLPNDSTLSPIYQPSSTEVSSGAPITLTLSTLSNGKCNSEQDQMVVSFSDSPIVDAGDALSVCANNSKATFTGKSSTKFGIWSGGTGNFSSISDSIITYTPSAAELSAAPSSVKLFYTTTNNANCLAVKDSVLLTITKSPTADAGVSQTLCSNNPSARLAGSLTVATGGIWSGGLGSYTPNETDPAARYIPSAEELAAKRVRIFWTTTTGLGGCNAVSDSVIIQFTSSPSVDAGPDQVICESIGSVSLNGSVTVAGSGQWSNNGIVFANSPIASYTITNSDRSNGFAKLVLSTTNNGGCIALGDTMYIFLSKVPSANAGPDQTICTTEYPIDLSAVSSSGSWSVAAGKGTIANSLALNTKFVPSASAEADGFVQLTYTASASGACPSVSDNVRINLIRGPSVNAGSDLQMCGNSPTISLSGGITGVTTTGVWVTPDGAGSIANASSISTIYTPSSTERRNGAKISFVLTSTANGVCLARRDTVNLNITPSITVDAGPNMIVCSNNTSVSLVGNIRNTTISTWSSPTGGVFSPTGNVVTSYTPSAVDISNRKVTLSLVSNPVGNCVSFTDTITVYIDPAPTVSAGSNFTVCGDTSAIQLSGVSSTSSGSWSTNGLGIFSPSPNALTTKYIPTSSEKSLGGSINFSFASGNNGVCNISSANVQVTVLPSPTVNAGSNDTLCADGSIFTLNGTRGNTTSSIWTSSGSGVFGNASTLNSTYTPSISDISSGLVTLTLRTSGPGSCKMVSDNMVLRIVPKPQVFAGADRSICQDYSSALSVAGSISNAKGGIWSRSGSGTFGNATSLTTVYNLSNVDRSLNSFNLILTTTGNGRCNAVSDTMLVNLTPRPTTGPDSIRTICADFNSLHVEALSSTGSGIWTSSSGGAFGPKADSLKSNYIINATDISNGNVVLTFTSTGNGSCQPVTSKRTITITPAPTANAGADLQICADRNSITLSGTRTIASNQVWTSSGTGTFNDSTSLTPVYTPSLVDKTAGSVLFSLKTKGNGLCKAVSDQSLLRITTIPTIDAGPNESMCADQTGVQLDATVRTSTGVVWSGGTGVFDNTNLLSPKYFPSTTELSSAPVKIVLTATTTGNGLCNAVSDQMEINIAPKPTVNSGSDLNICGDVTGTTLNGNVTVATNGVWSIVSGGSGTFSPSANSIITTYNPSLTELTSGATVTLKLASVGNGLCQAAEDLMTVIITPRPTISAGGNISMCADNDGLGIGLGTISGAPGAIWSTSGSGAFSDNGNFNATYLPSSSDKANGSVLLTLSTTPGTTTCKPISASRVLTINPAPVINAGPDLAVCLGIDSVSLSGTVRNATGGTWSSLGTGSFSKPNELATRYAPSASDNLNGSVTLILSSTGNGVCSSSDDSITVRFQASPSVNAGPAKTVCNTNLPISLEGSGTTGRWSITNGVAGTFLPNDSTLNASFTPSVPNFTGNIAFRLSSIVKGSCLPSLSNVNINVIQGPVPSAPANQTVCTNQSSINLVGAVTFGNVQWSTSGTGTFGSANALSTTYNPSDIDKQAGSVVLTLSTFGGSCSSIKDTMLIKFDQAPIISAGPDREFCRNVSNINLTASFTNATGIVWNNLSGTGSNFSSSTSSTTTYSPTFIDGNNGIVRLEVRTTSGTGVCPPVSDTVAIILSPLNVSNAGNDTLVCANVSSIGLNGRISNAKGAIWKSFGAGSFTPDSVTLVASYSPAPQDITNGSVKLLLETSGNGNCPSVKDSMIISFLAVPSVVSGEDQVLCANVPSVGLVGSRANVTNVVWKSFGTGSFVDSTLLNPTYTPSALDRSKGLVSFQLSSKDNTVCSNVSDVVEVLLAPLPVSVVNAGIDQSLCEDIGSIQLEGIVKVAGGGKWSTFGGTGSFVASDSTLNAFFVPSNDTKKAGNKVTLVLSTVKNGVCGPARDSTVISFTNRPRPSTNDSIVSICADSSKIQLGVTENIAKGVIWSTTGNGVFVPNEFSKNPIYFPAVEDLSKPEIGITVTTLDNGTCNGNYSDQMVVRISKTPTISLGSDPSICTNNASYQLNAVVSNSTGLKDLWTTSSGLGTFSSAATITNPKFTPDVNDIARGAVLLTFTTDQNGTCKPVSKSLLITITPSPVVFAGSDRTLCVNNAFVPLNSSVSGGASSGVWATTGNGSFVPDPSTVAIQYLPSVEDLSKPFIKLALTSSGNTNGSCIPVTDSVVLNFTPAPKVTASSISPCVYDNGVAVNGKVSGGAISGKWKTNGTGSFSPNPFSLNAIYFPSPLDKSIGTVKVTLVSTDFGNCNPDSSIISLLVAPLPFANAGSDRYVCRGVNDTLIAATVDNQVYDWSEIGGPFALNNSLSAVVGPITKNQHVYQLKVTDNKGCIEFDTITVSAVDNPNFNLDSKFCLQPQLKVTASAPAAVTKATFQWYKDNVLVQGANDTILRVNQPGTYTINYSLGRCNRYNAVTRVIQPPILITKDYTYCKNEVAIASVRSLLPGLVTYSWSLKGGSNFGVNNDSVSSIITLDTTIFRTTVTDTDNCPTNDSVFIFGIPKPIMGLTLNTQACTGNDVVLNATPSVKYTGAIRQWMLNSTTLNDTTAILVVKENGNGPGKYIVTYTVDQCTAKDTADVVFNPLPISPLVSGAEFCSLTQDSLILNANPLGTNVNIRYKWLTSALPEDTLSTFAVDSSMLGGATKKVFTVQLTNQFNCIIKDSILVNDFCVPKVFIPSALTPGSDGPNKTIKIFAIDKYIKNFELFIFNRWGEIIYRTNDPSDEWDGTYRDVLMQVGSYPYVITYESTDPRDLTKYKQNGKITVVR